MMNYHEEEYQIAINPSDPRHLMPTIGDHVKSVLDVGCGAGQSLAAILKAHPYMNVVGYDQDGDAIAFGRTQWPDVRLKRGQGESLGEYDASFDLVMSRVALSYMDIPKALDEMVRVLKPGGQLWLAVHTWGFVSREIRQAIQTLAWKRLPLLGLVALNGLALRMTGRVFGFRGGHESWQEPYRMTALLAERGFMVQSYEVRGHVAVVVARKIDLGK